jgi:hypothetical protein
LYCTYLDDDLAVLKTFKIRLALSRVGSQPRLCQGFVVAIRRRALDADEFQNLPEWNADLYDLRWQAEQFAELPVGDDELQVGVKDGDALADVIERSLQNFAIEMQRRMGIVE